MQVVIRRKGGVITRRSLESIKAEADREREIEVRRESQRMMEKLKLELKLRNIKTLEEAQEVWSEAKRRLAR